MKALLEQWKKIISKYSITEGIEDFEDAKDVPPTGSNILRRDVIDYLIDTYAKNPSGPVALAVKYANFRTFYDKRMWDAAASYDAQLKALFLNTDVKDFGDRDWVMVTIHEIFHYNQHMTWNDKKNISYRKKITTGVTLPPGYTRSNLDKLDFQTLSFYWNKNYPNEKDDPMEKEAWAQTDKVVNTATEKAKNYANSLKK